MRKYLFLPAVLLLSLAACTSKPMAEDFRPWTNFSTASDTLLMEMDLTDAIAKGVMLPSDSARDPWFRLQFQVRNPGKQAQRLYYKVYYQNESYKFPEFTYDTSGKLIYNPRASANFYGSWNVAETGFHATDTLPADGALHLVTDSIRILGNPRDEQQYFGGEAYNSLITEEAIERRVGFMRKSADWVKQIREKAKMNRIPVEKQFRMDAEWILAEERRMGGFNNRWKRNPRAGVYSFLLVVATEEDLKKIPAYVQDVTRMDSAAGRYMNPYYYFLHQPQREDKALVIPSKYHLRTKARLNPAAGVFANRMELDHSVEIPSDIPGYGTSDELFYHAHFEQFFHHVDRNYKFSNIPMTYDVTGDNYTREMYAANSTRFPESALIRDHVKVTEKPGSTVGYDPAKKALFLKNPGNGDGPELRKEHVGIRTRHGFTYGKYRARIEFPKMLSQDQVWNGLTCAYWLIYEPGTWNNRSVCNTGYIPKYVGGENPEKIQQSDYSEIDIEIVKVSKYWPASSYADKNHVPVDDCKNDNVIVTCTNWDLACHDPKNFNIGARRITDGTRTAELHRWDDWYKALTSKYESPQDLTLGRPVYFEIDWQPERIIWRMGLDKEHMMVIGFMDDNSTVIPDNQMIAIVSQEFHDAAWWPTAPFNQNFVPFPKRDLTGYWYELEIE